MTIILDQPPQLILPDHYQANRPAIIRPGVDLARYFPVELNRHSKRAIIKELVDTGRLTPEQGKRVSRGMIPFGAFNPAPAGAAYSANAVNFDGTNDYMTRGAALTGASDSKTFTMSLWFRTGIDAAQRSLWSQASATGGSTFRNTCRTNGGSNQVCIFGHNSAGTSILDLRTASSSVTIAAGWLNWLVSVDMTSTSTRHTYLNDVSNGSWSTYVNDTYGWSLPEFSVGARTNGNEKWNGDVSDFLFWPGVYTDFSVTANRRLFISAAGKPVDPDAASGAIATLGTPLVRMTNSLSTWHTNAGSGGGFTLTGALTAASSSPSA